MARYYENPIVSFKMHDVNGQLLYNIAHDCDFNEICHFAHAVCRVRGAVSNHTAPLNQQQCIFHFFS